VEGTNVKNGNGGLVLMIGGARSGKSRLAEDRAEKSAGPVAYIATAGVFDDEMAQRVKTHRERRPGEWLTVEERLDLSAALARVPRHYAAVIVDCLTLWLANLLLERYEEGMTQAALSVLESDIHIQLEEFCFLARQSPFQTIVVANEVGCGIVPESSLGRVFRDIAGRANQYLASQADCVCLAVAGLPLYVKGEA
jgi:adenosylcobinamide kinase/adenosylcobinamide-phosphate guanylyltransferase